jgi:hypothetical protein
MTIINSRSPKFYTLSASGLVSAELKLSIWNGNFNLKTPTPDYILNKKGINSIATFEVSELISDFIDITFNGDYNSKAVWVNAEITSFDLNGSILSATTTTELAFNSYTYFEEPNATFPKLLMSNKEVFILDGETFNVPVFVDDENILVQILKQGVVLFEQTLIPSDNSSEKIQYVKVGDFKNSFADRVEADGGVIESENCLSVFDDVFNGADLIKINGEKGDAVRVKNISECKYEPKKITFVNKFGALQDMFFFKKSVEKLAVKKESYKANTIDAYGIYNTSQHTIRDFNITAEEKITLNSGYLSEEYNEVFKQLLLSDKVWLTNYLDGDDQVLPVNVKSKDVTYKTSVNDKLVDYSIEFENSFNVINNIR